MGARDRRASLDGTASRRAGRVAASDTLGGGARIYGGRFTPKGSFDTLYLSSDLITVGLEIGAVFGTAGAVSPNKDPFTVVTVNGRLVNVLDLTSEVVRTTLDIA